MKHVYDFDSWLYAFYSCLSFSLFSLVLNCVLCSQKDIKSQYEKREIKRRVKEQGGLIVFKTLNSHFGFEIIIMTNKKEKKRKEIDTN